MKEIRNPNDQTCNARVSTRVGAEVTLVQTVALWRRLALVILSSFVLSHSSIRADPAVVVGWRNDGTGCFPDQRPPVRWSDDKNIVWKTDLPAPSRGSPIIVGDWIFCHANSDLLLGIRRSDGKLLWQRKHPFSE